MNKPGNPSAADAPERASTTQDREIAENAELMPSEVAILRAALLAARQTLERKLSSQVDLAVPDESHFADEMDQASRDQEMGFSLLLAGKDQNLRTEIDAALTRLDDGSYGLCEGTDEPIGFRRLEACPWTRYSVGYQEQREREERSRGAR